MTPQEFWVVIAGDRDRWMEAAWHVAAMTRAKRFPRLAEVLGEQGPRPALGPEALLAKVRMVNAMLGGSEAA